MVPSPKRTSNWVDSFWLNARTSTRRFAGRKRFPTQSMARWRSDRCGQRKHSIRHGMTIASQIEKTFREEHGRVLATLISQLGDFVLAEDALQDALVNALERWQVDGVPRNPGAWLTTVAKRRAIDRLRRAVNLSDRKLPQLVAIAAETEDLDEA